MNLPRHHKWIAQRYSEQDFLGFLIDANKEVSLVISEGLCLEVSILAF